MQQIYPKIYQPATKKGSPEAKRKKRNWYTNWQRGKKFASAPLLSPDEEERLIKDFLAQGKGKRYPRAATGNPMFSDDAICNDLLKQVIPIEVDDG